MSDPQFSCALCGRVVMVDYYARGFPPEAAMRKLKKACKAEGCPCDPAYRAGVG